mgnify:CR=1 FL=1
MLKPISHDVALGIGCGRDRLSIALHRREHIFRDAHAVVESAAIGAIEWCAERAQDSNFVVDTIGNQQPLHIVPTIVGQSPTGHLLHLLLETAAQSAAGVVNGLRCNDATR